MKTAIAKTIFIPAATALLLLLLSVRGTAQSLPGPAWYVISSGGGSTTLPFQGQGWAVRQDSAVISYTVGESCIAFDHMPDFDVTEGFQQPDGYGLTPYTPINEVEQVTFYPNPCQQFAFVSFYLNTSFTNIALKVFDVRGRAVYEDSFQAGDGQEKYQMPTAAMAPGMYIVEIVDSNKNRFVGKLIVIP
jgi:hypothetical protein